MSLLSNTRAGSQLMADAEPKRKLLSESVDDIVANLPKPQDEYLLEGQRTLDAGTQGEINKQIASGMTDYTPELVSGVSEYSDFGQDQPNLTGKPGYDAISERQKQRLGDTSADIERQTKYQERLGGFDRLSGAAQNLGQFEKLKLNNFQQKQLALQNYMEIQRKKDEERSGLLGTILGIGGALIGGPLGAIAGKSAGDAVE